MNDSRRPPICIDLAGLLVLGGVLVTAVAVRWPYLQLVPVITDEAFEVQAALSMLGGRFIWFGPFDPTTGPLITWLLALAFRLFGVGPYVPRLVMLVLGAATAGLAFGLGRSFAADWARVSSAPKTAAREERPANVRGLLAGGVAGLLMACNPVHTLVNSHVAWSNSATPLFVAAALLVLHAAMRRANGWLLVVGGLLVGLALQTHISVLVVLPGLVVWFLARRDVLSWLRRPWPYLAVGAALLGYGNMIVYNLVSAGGALANVQLHTYAWESNPTLATYVQNMGVLIANAARTLSGQVPRVDDPLAGVVMGLTLAWLAGALIYSLVRRETMPVLVILSTVLIMPYFNKRYEGLLSQRYIAFLLPLCFAVMGWLLSDLVSRVSRHLWQQPSTGAVQARGLHYGWLGVGGALLLAGLVLAAYPVRNTLAYYAAETKVGRDNRVTLALAHYLDVSLPEGTEVLVSSGLKDKEEGGGYRFVRAVDYYLSLNEVSHRVLDFPVLGEELEASQAAGRPVWLVLTQEEYKELALRFPPLAALGMPGRLQPVTARPDAGAGPPALPNGALVVELVR